MPHSYGYRSHTRKLFKRAFRQHGPEHLSTYLKVYKVGDYVDIIANSSIHKGMPHKFYHGRTGIVYNVTKSAVGVLVNKRVGNRFIEKKVNLRIEHVRHSKCREDFIKRKKENSKKQAEAQAAGIKVILKRQPAQPREACFVDLATAKVETLSAVAYEALV
ncbi:60S ribosomal protein L21A [Coelomomyces lativittatus]|nr:60S ribosomal protein L21A [Coelomomyces lativittatus]KAJ1507477.1 60S ribosomal protein L21A [Coelomomyces lativittatus]KAJ1514217.1 60S ribosomal protein L21A [Coelomomyces lativittatus]